MVDTKVESLETLGRLAQWRIENLGPISCKRSDHFKMGIWNWTLTIQNGPQGYILLTRESNLVSKVQPPFTRVLLRLTTAGSNRKSFSAHLHGGGLVESTFSRRFDLDKTYQGRLVVDAEFYPSFRGDGVIIWPNEDKFQHLATQSKSKCLSRMLNESLFSDITINTSDGKLRAHRAILSASSPVFHSMFLHDLKEKQSSTIDIEDMTTESCTALLGYIYETINKEVFWSQRLPLLAAANKYDISDLKDACEESLLEDIGLDNVLERLQEASVYHLDKLKKGCMAYLLDFGKIHDLREDMIDFFRRGDKDLVGEMFQEVLNHLA